MGQGISLKNEMLNHGLNHGFSFSVSVSVLGLNQKGGFGRTLLTIDIYVLTYLNFIFEF